MSLHSDDATDDDDDNNDNDVVLKALLMSFSLPADNDVSLFPTYENKLTLIAPQFMY